MEDELHRRLEELEKEKVALLEQLRRANTGGGAAVAGDVDTGGGDFVGRDQTNINQLIVQVSEQLVRSLGKASVDLHPATRTYLTFLYDQYRYLSMKGLGVSDQVPLRLELLELYVPLRARLELPHGETWQEEARLAGRRLSKEEQEQMRLSEPQPVIAMLQTHAGLVLLGDPGAGKSTFLKFLALKMALGEGETLGLGERLPVLVPLAAYANALEEEETRLDDFIHDYFCSTCGDLPVGEMLRQALAEGRALVLLDGLDEVRKLGLRTTVVERVAAFYNFHRRAGNKFVITSRIVGYRDARPEADDLVEGTLVDFDEDEIAVFVDRWTQALERQAQGKENAVASREAGRERDELLAAIRHNANVRRLAANPLLLTILAVMKRQGVTLPERRVELYEQYIKTMLAVWNRARSLSGRATAPELDVTQTVRILAPLALWMHEVNPGVGLVKREEMRRKLVEIYVQRGDSDPQAAADGFLSDVHVHTGLLLERGPGEYGFIHLTFEEYLAGTAIALQGQGSAEAILAAMRPHVGDPLWSEVLLLGVGYLALIQQLDRVAEQVIVSLADEERGPEGCILAGEVALDLRTAGLSAAARQAVQAGLVETLTGTNEKRKAPAVVRARAGVALGRLGDPRPEVMTIEGMLVCYVPAGLFWIGGSEGRDQWPHYRLNLAAFWIGQHPVSQAQYDFFVQDNGYTDERWWGEALVAGYWVSQGFKGEFDDEPRLALVRYGEPFDLPNHPVVGVSWYEALAFTRWLDERARGWGWRAFLPNEVQWEKAAQGGEAIPERVWARCLADGPTADILKLILNPSEGRDWPWGGGGFDMERANVDKTGLGATSALGCFPGGAGPYGALDLAGNVWEWTSSLKKYLYDARDGRESLLEDGNRVLRGGAFGSSSGLVRCAYRYGYDLNSCSRNLGFRVAFLPAP